VSAVLFNWAGCGLNYFGPPDDQGGILIKEVLIPHLHDLRQLAPAGLSILFMHNSLEKFELLLFEETEDFDSKLDSANIKYVLRLPRAMLMSWYIYSNTD
jgi:hypothetical protein